MLGVEGSVAVPLLKYCDAIDCSFEDCRECAGGVGGRSGRPIRFEACFRVRGLELYEVEGEVRLVSSDNTWVPVDGGEEYESDDRSRLGCGKVLCLLNEPPLNSFTAPGEASTSRDGILRCERLRHCVCVRSIQYIH